jgi:nitrite reductase (NO-forming)
MTVQETPRRCRHRARPLPPGGLRPTDLLGGFFVVAIGFLVAAGAIAVLDTAGALPSWGHWLALHLAFLGGVSLLVLGAAQFFTTAFLATDPPGRRMARAQLGVWTLGTVLVAAGIPAAVTPLTDAGGLLIVVSLGLFGASLWRLERRSLQQARWAVRWYYACAASLGVGALVGVAMARGVSWPHGSLLGAHLALNVAGWLGTAIVGTLHTFFPSLTQTRLRRPHLQPPAFAAWLAGVVLLAFGAAFDVTALLAAGWVALACGAALLAVNVVEGLRVAPRPLSLPARMVGAGQAFLVTGLLAAVAVVLADGAHAPLEGRARAVLAILLVVGWIGMTVAGSLLHLLTVLHRVRNLARAMPAATPGRDRALVGLAMAAVAALAIGRATGADGLAAGARVALVAAAALVAARVLVLAGRAVGSACLRF